ncbi:MAG: helix-turn-helix transcriptional regulator [Alphaproteobacteria bacterium]|nr:helix-turn-helix transcriptional regulator [Alphaproteobacteria bacterium]
MSRPSAAARDPSPASVFAALGDRTRLALLMKLSDGRTQSIARLSADTRLTRQAVTKHLHVLERAGLVSSIRVGRESRFAYHPEPVAAARTYLDMVAAHWDGALSRLRAMVEE